MDRIATERLLAIINGMFAAQIAGTLAQLGIPDILAGGADNSASVAAAGGTEPGATFRLLRAAAAIGLLKRSGDRFALAPMGELLTAAAPNSMRAVAMMRTLPNHWLPWGRLAEAVRTGRRQSPATLGSELFPYLAQQPLEAEAFHGAMEAMSVLIGDAVARALDTSAASHVVDVGGGNGGLVAALLDAHPHLRGTIYDLPEAAKGARELLARRGLMARCEVVSGDFFDVVPPADLILVKHILHDWDDAQCVRILSNCAAALAPAGQIAIVEAMMPDGDGPPTAAFLDLNMLVQTPGRERTAAEYAALCNEAGLLLTTFVAAELDRHVLIATRPR